MDEQLAQQEGAEEAGGAGERHGPGVRQVAELRGGWADRGIELDLPLQVRLVLGDGEGPALPEDLDRPGDLGHGGSLQEDGEGEVHAEAWFRRASTRGASREWPPSWKKESCRPTRSTWRISRQTAATPSSAPVRGSEGARGALATAARLNGTTAPVCAGASNE